MSYFETLIAPAKKFLTLCNNCRVSIARNEPQKATVRLLRNGRLRIRFADKRQLVFHLCDFEKIVSSRQCGYGTTRLELTGALHALTISFNDNVENKWARAFSLVCQNISGKEVLEA
jgi:hypothetical protein